MHAWGLFGFEISFLARPLIYIVNELHFWTLLVSDIGHQLNFEVSLKLFCHEPLSHLVWL